MVASSHSVQEDNDRPPPERSARVRPTRHGAVPRRHNVDPRFSDLYGRADPKQFGEHYRFLREQQAEEETRRRDRMRRLQCIVRRNELESNGADLEEYDLSETEWDVFGDAGRGELQALKLTPPSEVVAELQQLQRASQLYKSNTSNEQIRSRRDGVRREVMRREAAAVKEGTKQRVFVPKRAQLKRQVLADTFERLEQKGGKGAVDRYMERKIKRR